MTSTMATWFYLVENKSLADWTPLSWERAEVKDDGQDQHHNNGRRGVNGANQETHDHTAYQAQSAGVPGKILKGGP